MKIKLKTFAVLACTALCVLPLTACKDKGKCTVLGKPATVTAASYEEKQSQQYVQFKAAVENFASQFAADAYADYGKYDNFAVSPVSVYMALSLVAECTDGATRNEITNALGTSYEQLRTNFSVLYRSLFYERKSGRKITGILYPTNSVWLNEGVSFNSGCVDALSDYYFCHSYSADFANDNSNANKAVRYFVSENTRGLIDKDFDLPTETVFTLINTLYLKTLWNVYGDELPYTPVAYVFKNADGSVTNRKLMTGYYKSGRVYKGETFSTFYTSTYDGYKLKFILPNDGYTADEVFTAENISAVNTLNDYNDYDHENKIHYYTRCLFPEYNCSYDGDIDEILGRKFGIQSLFDLDKCDLSPLMQGAACCGKVRHVTKLKVDRRGIEGAAVVVIPGAGAPGPDGYEEVYQDFVLDRSFGFIISDRDDVTLFSGVVKSV